MINWEFTLHTQCLKQKSLRSESKLILKCNTTNSNTTNPQYIEHKSLICGRFVTVFVVVLLKIWIPAQSMELSICLQSVYSSGCFHFNLLLFKALFIWSRDLQCIAIFHLTIWLFWSPLLCLPKALNTDE